MNVSDTISEVATFTGIDYTVFTIILSFSVLIGIYFAFFSDKLKTNEDYLAGGHNMKSLPIGISLVASQISAFSIISVPAEVYSFGWHYMLIIPSTALVSAATNYLVLPVYYRNCIDNCYVYLEMRFGRTIRRFVTIIFIVSQIFYLPVVMYIPSLSFVEVTKHNIHVVNSIVSCVCIVYTMLGGIQAVVWTDVLQAAVMLGSVLIIAFYGIMDVGGVEEVWNRAVNGSRVYSPDFTLDLVTRTTFWNTTSSLFFIWICHSAFTQSNVQRLTSCTTLRTAQKSMIYLVIGVTVIMLSTCANGIIMYAYYYLCDPVKAGIVSKPDKLTSRFVQDVTGHIPGMSGVFISCVFSASLSTVSASLHSLSGIFYNDYIRPRKWFAHTDGNANLTMRVIIMMIGLFCALSGFIIEHFQSVFQMVVTIVGTGTGAIVGSFSLGMLYPWANKQGILSGMLISMASICFIIINTHYNISKGQFRYDVLPTSIDGCNNETIGQFQAPPKTFPSEPDEGFALHKIAFQWYPLIGVILMCVPAIIISHLTGGQDLTKLNVLLLSPCAQKLVPKKYRHIQLKRGNKGSTGHQSENEKKMLKPSLETKWTFIENSEVKLN
ncbi:sodium-coupled monocarboxylate transporter 2-like [Sitodiplosis mosellana]|uniref:sodium-coupled monocarboxylate transporter 2-like n=1 Tax=Sitodiplosis mosellana TaxID=263140 RepID=UPI002443FBCE|nr:sodium-coupled monocarboxylate transporter 2-like [Sitodiplosis mosellana]